MSTVETISNELSAVATEGERIFSWRHASLLAVGYQPRLAFKLALRSEIDLHQAVELVRHGCPPATAARILL
jgi:hypothetical protein